MEKKQWFEKHNLDGSIDLVYAANVDEAEAAFGNYDDEDEEGGI